MKEITLLAALALLGALLRAAEPALTQEERAQAIRLLNESREEFVKSVEGLTDAQWTYKPGPDRWSVGEVAEHILLSEGGLFSRMQEALANKPNPDWETKTAGKTEFLMRVMPNRDRKAQAPEPLQPQSKMTRAQIMSQYREARARTLKFIRETELPLKAHTAEHPFPVFNTLNAYQWLIYIPLHNIRHDKQIEEVKASSGFPR